MGVVGVWGMGMSEEIIEKLRRLWDKYPEQRFGQLLKNYVFNGDVSMWELSEEDIVGKLDKWLGEGEL